MLIVAIKAREVFLQSSQQTRMSTRTAVLMMLTVIQDPQVRGRATQDQLSVTEMLSDAMGRRKHAPLEAGACKEGS